MILWLPSGLKIAVSPFFFWEGRQAARLTIRASGVFHPSHVTTRLCLELVEQTLGLIPCCRFLDVGCGCGIFSLLAAYRGVPLAVGLDIDHRAVLVAQANAFSNQLDTRCHWITGTLTALRGQFDCVVANLPYAALLEVLDDLTCRLADSGRLILSGFQDVQWGALHALLQSKSLAVEQVRSGDFTFYGVPPSGSFTWMAVLVHSGRNSL